MGAGLEGAMVITVGGEELDALRDILARAYEFALNFGHDDLVAKIDLFEEAFE